MDFDRIWKNIERVKAWYQDKYTLTTEIRKEILKPLNKLIDFEHQECIYENPILLQINNGFNGY